MKSETKLLQALQHAKQGNTQNAKKILLNILKKEPQNHNALYNLGEIFRMQKNWKKAYQYFTQTLNLIPNDPDTLFGIADTLTQTQNNKQALPFLQKAAQISPNDPEIITRLAENYATQQDHKNAIPIFQHALNLEPKNPAIWLSLIQTLHAISAWNSVIKLAKDAQNILKTNTPIQILNLHADAHLANEQPNEAIEKTDTIITQTKPNNIQKYIAMITKAAAHNHKGEFNQAKNILRTLIKNKHTNPNEKATALEILSTINALKTNDIRILQKLTKEKNLTPQSNADIQFALYRYHNQNQDYNNAFQNLKNANDILKKINPFNKQTHDKMIKDTINLCSEKNIRTIKNNKQDGKGIIFIIGMPRSGTTLIEHILAASPNLCPKGEFTLFSRYANTIQFPHDIFKNTQKNIKDIAQKLQHEILPKNQNHTHATDKTPGHYLFVGLIQAILPEAKIIYCSRNPKNVTLSLYENQFRGHILNYSYDLTHIAHVYNAHVTLMNHWCALETHNIYPLDYQKLTHDPQTHIRKLYQFCNIPWNDKALTPEKIKRNTLSSASFYQARQPIKPANEKKWQTYQDQMHPFLETFNHENYQKLERNIQKIQNNIQI